MAFYKNPAETLLQLVAEYNNLSLDPEDYDFSLPQVTAPPADSDASYNTLITLSSNNPAAPYIGSVDIKYNRLDLTDLETLIDIYVYSEKADTTYDVLEPLNNRYGLSLGSEDIEDLPCEEKDGYVLITLQAKSSSLGWIGTLKIPVAIGNLVLEDHLLETHLDGLKYPTDDPTRPYAYFYSYWRDFSEFYGSLVDYRADDPIDTNIVSMINEVTGDIWVGAGENPFSLGGATIVSNRPTLEEPASNQEFDRVMVIRLDPTLCTGLSGDLIIHYSEDPYQLLGI